MAKHACLLTQEDAEPFCGFEPGIPERTWHAHFVHLHSLPSPLLLFVVIIIVIIHHINEISNLYLKWNYIFICLVIARVVDMSMVLKHSIAMLPPIQISSVVECLIIIDDVWKRSIPIISVPCHKNMCMVWCNNFPIAVVFDGFVWSWTADNEPDICLFLEGEW